METSTRGPESLHKYYRANFAVVPFFLRNPKHDRTQSIGFDSGSTTPLALTQKRRNLNQNLILYHFRVPTQLGSFRSFGIFDRTKIDRGVIQTRR